MAMRRGWVRGASRTARRLRGLNVPSSVIRARLIRRATDEGKPVEWVDQAIERSWR